MTSRRLLASACCWLAVAAAAPSNAATDERARISSQRQLLESGFAAEEAACRTRFVVTPCVDDVRARRRNALATLREEDVRLDEAERRERAAAKLQSLKDKKAAVASRQAPAPATSAPVARGSLPLPLRQQPRERRRPDGGNGDAEAAARRAVAAQRLRDGASDKRSRIAAREAGRAKDSKRSAPLPTPGASAAGTASP